MSAKILLLSLITITASFMYFRQTPREDVFERARAKMVRNLAKDGITDQRVLAAMLAVKRHLFVSKDLSKRAYENRPLPIEEGQTISQPYVVALMTQELQLEKSDKVLEIGTGSGYQAAVLAEIVDSVYSIEIKEKLASSATQRLQELGYDNVKTKCADGYFGWEEHAPFDAIIITCAVNHVPSFLLDQLKVGGRLILPLGSTRYNQVLTRIRKTGKKILSDYLGGVAFVPMTGVARKK